MRIEYPRDDAQRTAWAAIDRGETVEIVICSPWRVRFARRTLPLCRYFFESDERSLGAFLKIMALMVYGAALLPLLFIYSHAVLAGMRGTWRESEGTMLVSFAPADLLGGEPCDDDAR